MKNLSWLYDVAYCWLVVCRVWWRLMMRYSQLQTRELRMWTTTVSNSLSLSSPCLFPLSLLSLPSLSFPPSLPPLSLSSSLPSLKTFSNITTCYTHVHLHVGSLMYLNEATLLHNLRMRYTKGQIYVRKIHNTVDCELIYSLRNL